LRERWGYYGHAGEVDSCGFGSLACRRRRWFRPDWPRAEAEAVLQRWEALCESPAFLGNLKEIARRHKRKTLTETPIEGPWGTFLAKYYAYPRWRHKLQSSLYYSEARRNCATAAYLADRGVRVPRPLALVEFSRFGVIRGSFLFMERLDDRFAEYKRFLPALGAEPRARRKLFFATLGRKLGLVHRLGVHTEDLDKNTMIDPSGRGFRVAFLDFDNVFPWRLPTFRRTVKCLVRFLGPDSRRDRRGLSRGGLRVFLGEYVGVRERPGWFAELEGALGPHVVRRPG
jgi:hypothetical protein